MSMHIETALDQLRLAEDCGDRADPTWEQQAAHALAAAQVHATLALAEAVREAAGLLMPFDVVGPAA